MSQEQNKQKKFESYIIKAVLISSTKDSMLFNCEGDVERFPKSQVQFDETTESLTVPRWLLKKKWPNEKW